jgi:hypothetical protein
LPLADTTRPWALSVSAHGLFAFRAAARAGARRGTSVFPNNEINP